MGARKGRWKTPLPFCKHHNILAILFCQSFATYLKFEYTNDISSHNFESPLRLIMTYGFKLVMIGNMCTRLQAVQNIQFHFQNFVLCFSHTKKYLCQSFDGVLHRMYYINRNKNPEQEASCSSLLYATSLQKTKNAWISFKFQLHFLNPIRIQLWMPNENQGQGWIWQHAGLS